MSTLNFDAGKVSVGSDILERMFEKGNAAGISTSHNTAINPSVDAAVSDACVAGLSVFAARCRSRENRSRAQMVETVCEIAEIRFADADTSDGDPLTVMRSVVCEVAAALGVSQRVARPLVDVGLTLNRLPLTALRMVCGVLDWARVTAIASVLGRACDDTIDALEFEALALAETVGPRILRLMLWQMWMDYDPQEASRVRSASVRGQRGLSMTQEGDGSSQLKVTMTDVEGAEAEALIEELVGSVCAQDPRSARELRVDALLALLHGEHALQCRCDRGEQCPQFGVADLPDGRRGHLIQILIEVETLLGLSQTPAVLADGTPLDPELARMLADDGKWQALLVELTQSEAFQNARRTQSTQDTDTDSDEPDDNDEPDNGEPNGEDPNDGGSDGGRDVGGGANVDASRKTNSANNTTTAPPPEPAPDATDEPNTAGQTSTTTGPTTRGARVWRLLFRGRIRPAATVPAHRPTTTKQHHRGHRTGRAAGTGRTPGGHYARTQLITALLTAITDNPALAAGLHPDGHGGHTSPPPGALTYRPSSGLTARIRMTYSTCTHPGCDIPSTRCQLDHIVPYNHTNPRHGGWSIEENLHPVCTGHHQLKTTKTFTAAMLTSGAILWTSPAGLRTITLPNLGCPTPPRTRKRARKNTTPDTTTPDLTTATWWETNMPPHTTPPTRTDLNTAHTDTARTRIRILRRHFRQHKHIHKLRIQHEKRNEPPPF
ncbi:DUF222 domain-containing protein [Rhodococcus sovatensis]|uniref:DUF222 domain-containing protein n=1 Tax=Rhodococcus sovatensis TaxID=1805840 RepID=A0ABZ2PEY8_9NOCA